MPLNTAAYLPRLGVPLEIRSAPYTPPAENEIVIHNAAIAVNPVDAILQFNQLWPLPYPAILGCDLAGTVVEVGDNVTRFRVGDRVVGSAGGGMGVDKIAAFHMYTVLPTNLVAGVPDALGFVAACVIPLGLSTAACGLFQTDFLGLPHPVLKPRVDGMRLLVWGAASSVGMSAVQLGVASGVEVVATASRKNFDVVRRLGAAVVVDYTSESVVEELVKEFKGRKTAGAIVCAGGQAEMKACVDVMARCEGRRFVASAIGQVPETLPEGVGAKFIFGSTLKDNEVGDAVYRDYLPEAMAKGKFIAAPEPEVVGKGLEEIQKALDIRREGKVSAKKIVVSL